MCGGGVQDGDALVFNERDGLPRRVVRQAEKSRVAVVERPSTAFNVAPLLVRQGDELYVRSLCQTLADAQPGGAGAAVDE